MKETFQGKSEDLVFKITNGYKVSFIKSTYNPESNSYWTRLIVRFSGENGEYFYSLVQKKLIDWRIFDLSCTNLGRFDLYYFRKFKSTDQDDLLELFMKNSCEKINAKSKRKKASWKRTSRGLILRIGNRSDSNYYHVYQKTKKITHGVYDEMNCGLGFELELKNQLIKSFQKFLFKNHLEEFEGRLVEHFYKYSKESFVLDTCYTDWLQIGLRKIVSKQKSEINSNSLVSSYLRKNSLDYFVQKKQFFKLIQLLSFIRTLEYSKQFINDQAYCVIEFSVMDFISFTGGNTKSTYQRTKALEFLTSLQDLKPLIQKFSDNEFRRSVMFLYLKLTKQNRRWTITITIGKEFYFYHYPFFFPDSFLIYKNKYGLEIKLQLIESFSQVELKTPKHGPDHGLPVDSKGKTPKTEANALALRDSLINMPNKPNVIWYKNGGYQRGTSRGYDTINVFDPDTNLIAVYQKQPDESNLFLTTSELTAIERYHLIATDGDFVTEKILNKQKTISTNIQDNTNNNNGLQ